MKTPAIVVHKMDFRETSRLIRLFTRELGTFTVLAKGAHRPKSSFTGILDLFHHIEATLSIKPSREIQTLTRARLLQGHLPLGRSPRRLACASYLVEAAGTALPEGRADQPLYDLLASGLLLLERFPTAKLDLAVLAWETRFLDVLGQGFALDRCPACGRRGPAQGGRQAFSVAEGGTLCPAHQTGLDCRLVASETLTLLDRFRRLPAPELARLQPPPANLLEATDLVRAAMEYRLEKRLRSGPIMTGL